MQTIGITAVTAKAAAKSYLHIVERGIQLRKQGPEIIVHSSSIDLCMKAIQQALVNNPTQLTEILIRSVEKLREAGATVGLIPNNSAHLFLEKVRENSPIKLVSIIDPVVEVCSIKKYTSVAIIGPTAVVKSKMFEKPLEDSGIRVITPNNSDQDCLHKIISTATQHGKLQIKQRQIVEKIFARLSEAAPLDALIVACSELTHIFHREQIQMSVINPFQLQAEAAFDEAMMLRSNA